MIKANPALPNAIAMIQVSSLIINSEDAPSATLVCTCSQANAAPLASPVSAIRIAARVKYAARIVSFTMLRVSCS